MVWYIQTGGEVNKIREVEKKEKKKSFSKMGM